MTRTVVVGAEVAPGRRPANVWVEGGVVTAIDEERPSATDRVIDAGGNAVVPGLHDHHVHLLATAAARSSVDASTDLAAAVRAARATRPTGWLRATGHHVGARGELDRHALDRIDTQPLRVQDHTGSTWFLNSAALAAVLDGPPPPGMELDDHGEPTGRLFRLDSWVRRRTGGSAETDLRAIGRELAALGVTAVTDATATNGDDELALLAAAHLPQRVVAMTGKAAVAPLPGIELGPVKVLLDDPSLPDLDGFVATVAEAHRHRRAVAVHCVTRVQLVLTLAAFSHAGTRPGDRIEHAAIVPDDLLDEIVRLGLTVATQPAFVTARGDHYLADVDLDDQPWLYRLRGLLDRGIRLLGSSDAPYGPIDPWVAVAAAVDRRTAAGHLVGGREAIDAASALGLYTGRAAIGIGAPADLVVTDRPWAALLAGPSRTTVTTTVVGGAVVYEV